MKIFVVNGQGGSGKSSFEQLISEQMSAPVGVTSMVAYVKQVAESLGWRGAKEPKDRLFLSRLKDALGDWDDSPFLSTCMMVKQMENDNVACCFIDAREPADIDRLKEKFNCKTILVTRGEATSYGNHADDEVFNYEYDIIIDNSGSLDALRDMANEFIEKEIKDNGDEDIH